MAVLGVGESVGGAASLRPPKTRLKKPTFSFGCCDDEVVALGPFAPACTGCPFDFSYPTCGAGAESASRPAAPPAGRGGRSREDAEDLARALAPTVALRVDLVLRLRSGSATGGIAGDFGRTNDCECDDDAGKFGREGTVFNLRGPPGIFGVGATS